MSERTVVLDCRWLSYSGAGRVTEMLLRGLKGERPHHRWVLWGPPEVAAHVWPGSEHVIVKSKPTTLSGQREWFAVPPADLVVFLHQQRPLCRVPALSMILDTTPVRYNRNWLDAWAKSHFLRRVGSISAGIVTISDFSSSCIERDLGVPRGKIAKISLPADEDLAVRVLTLAESEPRQDLALYVGLFLPHKNLVRLIEAFGATAFRQRGGRLLLVGGKAGAERFGRTLTAEQCSYVTIRDSCPQAELEHLYATSLFLVQPSLEEGFGLPVQEALSAGLPVCVSDGGALPEVTLGFAQHFDPRSMSAMADALDRTAERSNSQSTDERRALSAAFLGRTPSVADLARRMIDLVDKQLH